MSNDNTLLIALTTCPGSIPAKKIARELVSKKLAACVNIIPDIESYYTWENQVNENKEYLLLIKTTREIYPKLEQHIKAIHPYELPEIIAVPIHTGLDKYCDWIRENTSNP